MIRFRGEAIVRETRQQNLEQVSAKNGFFGLIMSAMIIAGVGLFGYAGLQGEYGMFRLFQVEAQEAHLRMTLEELQVQREELENRTERLSNDFLDLDLLDEQTRKVLGMARGDEIIIR